MLNFNIVLIMKYFRIILLLIGMGWMTGCNDFLDIVPDDIPSMDNAFSNRTAAEKYLFSCYNYLPNPTAIWSNPAVIGGDEIWWNLEKEASDFNGYSAIYLAQGYQNSNDPYLNFWDGANSGRNMFVGIRDCNIFLENIHKPRDIEDFERTVWVAEVKFLKAYFHFYLMQLYGPIPLMKENIPVSASPEDVRVHRDPVDDVVNYIVELIDEAVVDLPPEITSTTSDAGRITQPIALAVKAKVLVWVASPLFNGNPDCVNFVDNMGRQLISSTPDASKWQKAATAIKEAIDACHTAGNALYEYIPTRKMSDTTALKYTIRGSVTERWNKEIVWASTHNVDQLQKWCMPKTATGNLGNGACELGATLKIAEQFYTNNGIPINEDPDWDYAKRYETQIAGKDHQFDIKTGETTAKLNFYREPRFYASLGFDRGIFEGAGQATDASSWYLQARRGEITGFKSTGEHIPSGYFIKKLVNTESVNGIATSYSGRRYTYPIIRLADLYLLYAEALNEIKASPDAEVYQWIDAVRARAGLKGVVESWTKAVVPGKPNTQAGMREIIHRERLIELVFEGQRFSDLRRWKEAAKYLSEPVQGWNYKGETADSYYTISTYWNKRVFGAKDYLWPLKLNTLIVNTNLVQNPGWN